MRRYEDLREFLSALESEGELLRIKGEVSSELEITEITDRVSKSTGGGKALMFENVAGSEFPVVTNAFGSEKRMSMALGHDRLEELGKKIEELLDMQPPTTTLGKLSMVPELISLSRAFPKVRRTSRPPCQEIVLEGKEVDLGVIPVLRCWPMDGGRFITLPVVFTKGLKDRKRNLGMYRMQVFDRNTTGMHWHVHKDGSHNYNGYREEGKRMEIAVAIGTDPAVTYAATAPMPQGVDELLLAGFIRGAPVEMAKCRTIDMEVPATAEFVLEGYVDPEERRIEGPFGDHTGYYSLQDNYPVFHVTTITHREDAIYSATIVGRPPMEDCYMGKATERIFLPPFRKIFPEVLDYWMPWEGVFHNIIVVAIKKEYPMHARRVMSSIWGSNQMSFSKMVVVVDHDVPLIGDHKLLDHIMDLIDPWSDMVLTEGILDVLDHSSPNPLYGGKLGIDATRRIEGERPRQASRFRADMSEIGILERLKGKRGGYISCRAALTDAANPLFLTSIKKGDMTSAQIVQELGQDITLMGQGIIVLFDDLDLQDDSLVLWKAFNNVDPLRDIRLFDKGMIIDATKKRKIDGHAREWPEEMQMLPEVKDKIDRKAADLGLNSLLGTK